MSILWYQSGGIPDAIALSKRQSKLFLVYISGTDQVSKNMDELWEDGKVKSLCERTCVALKLIADSDGCKQFSAIYPVFCIPSAYFIDNAGKLVEALIHSPLSEFLKKIENVTKPYMREEPMQATEETASSAGESTSNTDGDKGVEKSEKKEEQLHSREKSPAAGKRDQNTKKECTQAPEREADKVSPNSALKKKSEPRQARSDDDVANQLKGYRSSTAGKFEKISEEEKQKAELKRSKLLEAQQKEEEERRAMKMSQSRLQFRMPDGSAMVQTFEANDCLSSAVNYIKNQNDPSLQGLSFQLSQLYPRRTFAIDDYAKSFRELDMVPTASLVVLPLRESEGSGSVPVLHKLFSLLMLILMLPFRFISELWRFVSGPAVQPPVSTDNVASGGSSFESSGQRQATGSKNVRKRRVGNMARLSDTADDDDNATWNGNSTQQM